MSNNGIVVIYVKDGKYKPAEIKTSDMKVKQNGRNDVFTVVEQQPEFPGGTQALMEFIRTNLRYPVPCVEDSIEGRVTLSFVIERDGSVTEISKLRSPNEDLTKEAIRVVSAMPKWSPGKQRGEAVRVRYVLPVTFRLK